MPNVSPNLFYLNLFNAEEFFIDPKIFQLKSVEKLKVETTPKITEIFNISPSFTYIFSFHQCHQIVIYTKPFLSSSVILIILEFYFGESALRRYTQQTSALVFFYDWMDMKGTITFVGNILFFVWFLWVIIFIHYHDRFKNYYRQIGCFVFFLQEVHRFGSERTCLVRCMNFIRSDWFFMAFVSTRHVQRVRAFGRKKIFIR